MPAKPATRQWPRHPVRTLTARRLRDSRRDLEKVAGLPAPAPARSPLPGLLAEARAGQDFHAPAASPPSTGTSR